MSQPAEQPRRFQCRHIHAEGLRCGSPCLRGEEFCYYHHTTRQPLARSEAQDRKGRHATFDLPLPEDRAAIQRSIGEVLRRIASHGIDPRRAGLLLYGLQIAALNLPKPAVARPETRTRHSRLRTQYLHEPEETIEDIVHHPTLGILAPQSELHEEEEQYLSPIQRILRDLDEPEPNPKPTNTILPNLSAASAPNRTHRAPLRRQSLRTHASLLPGNRHTPRHSATAVRPRRLRSSPRHPQPSCLESTAAFPCTSTWSHHQLSSFLPTSRRTFLQQLTAATVLSSTQRAFAQAKPMPGMSMPSAHSAHDQAARTAAPTPNPPHIAPPMLKTLALTPFVDPLPLPKVLRPTQHGNRSTVTLTMQEVHAKVHRDVPATRMWSYGPDALSPLIEARAGHPLAIRWINNLPTRHFLPIDYSLHGSGHDVPEVRAVAHLHGARVPPQHDGYPESWFTPGHSRTSLYPLEQDGTALWYHDHAMGINRINTYAGLFGMLLLRDQVEDALHLPSGKYEIPLILYDRDFTAAGQLFYDVSGDPASPWIPEFSADGILLNGKIRPFLEVEPRLYRFRLLNTANSRFFNLSLSNNQPLTQIGTDQGLLASPVEHQRLTLACAERADLLIDFSKLPGQTLHLRTGAYDILQFRVTGQPVTSSSIPKTLRPITRIPESTATKTRTITLHEYKDEAARSMVMLLNRKRWHEPTTEFPRLNSTEVWEFVNLTEDTHPMHLHLVRFQILDRRSFDLTDYLINKKLRFTAPAAPPVPHEFAWKDIVQCPPGLITRIIVPFDGYPGKYLYHCHILEHEANDMMRPFEVVPA